MDEDTRKKLQELVAKWRKEYPGYGDYCSGMQSGREGCADDLDLILVALVEPATGG
jgi:hypothetical protein